MNTTLPGGTARLVTGERGPVLPLLHVVNEADDYPLYAGPLGAARLFVRRDRYLIEEAQYGMKWGAFLANDPQGADVAEFAVSYTSAEHALRQALGVYFHLAGYDSTTLAADLRRVIEQELDSLNQPEGATS